MAAALAVHACTYDFDAAFSETPAGTTTVTGADGGGGTTATGGEAGSGATPTGGTGGAGGTGGTGG
ncbi:MAG: hypothetical protein JRI23_04940, partial [Deltaproteobacteria bacterium]|nr:hypothetical protein [Deltaproteobacteria bacterium]MBW2530896.1 hypothetical protein [Deltaproteobacteria bacterium]